MSMVLIGRCTLHSCHTVIFHLLPTIPYHANHTIPFHTAPYHTVLIDIISLVYYVLHDKIASRVSICLAIAIAAYMTLYSIFRSDSALKARAGSGFNRSMDIS